MDISSLFKGKAYSFREIGDNEDEKKFASTVLQKFNPDLEIESINILGVLDDYDLFSVYNKQNEKFTLKISLDESDKVLKKESSFLRSHKSPYIPEIVNYGKIKVGDDVCCLLSKVPEAESIRNHGRSTVLNSLNSFKESYKNTFFTSKRVPKTYKGSILDFCDTMNPDSFLSKDAINSFKLYTDYNLCLNFLLELKKQIKDRLCHVYEDLKYKCHMGISLDSIFYGSQGFYFDLLHNVSMGHPFVDYIDLLFELGVAKDDDKRICLAFCEDTEVVFDEQIYNSIYEVQIRKKLAELVISYIKEIYLYDSFRYERIFYIADIFSHCYKRFNSIDIFKKNREFIMKTICEPIFGVKA